MARAHRRGHPRRLLRQPRHRPADAGRRLRAPGREIVYHSENGILGFGPAPAAGEEDRELINAGKQPVTLLPGGVFFHRTDAFMMMRGGHIDVTVLGAFQVSRRRRPGELAHRRRPRCRRRSAARWTSPSGAKRVLVMTTHITRDGRPKLLTALHLSAHRAQAWSTASTPTSP